MNKSIVNNIINRKVYYINFGNVKTDIHKRISVVEKYAKAKFTEFIKNLNEEGDYVSLNETYISFDGNREQGKCIDYYAK